MDACFTFSFAPLPLSYISFVCTSHLSSHFVPALCLTPAATSITADPPGETPIGTTGNALRWRPTRQGCPLTTVGTGMKEERGRHRPSLLLRLPQRAAQYEQTFTYRTTARHFFTATFTVR